MKIDPEVLAILSTLELTLDERGVRIVEKIDRRAYLHVDKVLQALGGVWSRRKKAHVFDEGDPQALIEQAITLGTVQTHSDLGHFPTPPDLAAELVDRAGVRVGHGALEPSAGTGRIVDALLATGASVVAVERDPVRRRALDDRPSVPLIVAGVDDFLAYRKTPPEFDRATPPFDRVVMNPPFCRSGAGDHLDHVRRAHALLAPDGVLVSVMPSSLVFRKDRRYRELRAWCLAHGAIDPLPDGSFRSSGTDVSTVVIRLRARP